MLKTTILFIIIVPRLISSNPEPRNLFEKISFRWETKKPLLIKELLNPVELILIEKLETKY